MAPRQVVARHEERHRRPEVLPLPAETRGQPREPAGHHADVKVQPLDMRRANPGLLRVAGDDPLLGGYYLRRRVPPLTVQSFA